MNNYPKRLEAKLYTNPDFFKRYAKPGIDLGCGDRKEFWKDDCVTLDICNYNQDIIWNMCRTPWPIASNQFERIECIQTLEHIGPWICFANILNEIWRIGKPGARFIGAAPHYPSSPNYYRDISHCRPINEYTFDMFFENTPIHFGAGYGILAKFRKINLFINPNRDICWEFEVVK